MKALAILHRLIPVNRGLEKFFFFFVYFPTSGGDTGWPILQKNVCYEVSNESPCNTASTHTGQ